MSKLATINDSLRYYDSIDNSRNFVFCCDRIRMVSS